MVDIPREGFGLLLKLGRAILKSEESSEAPIETTTWNQLETANLETEPMKAYWETDKRSLENNNQPLIDLYLKEKAALDWIPDTTDEPVKELLYKYEKLSLGHLPNGLANLNINGVPETPKLGAEVSNSGRDASVVAGIVVAAICGVLFIVGVIAAVMYKHYVHHNVTSMNFDNPVYRKTTEDQFALEKNGYAPGSKLYPSTVGEEAQQPLKPPGTNEFV